MTLVELLVVIAIIATISAIAIPQLMSGFSHTKLKRAAREISAELHVARNLALSRNRLYRVEFTLGTTDSYKRSFSTDNTTWTEDVTMAPRDIDSVLDITSPGSSFNITFRPNSTTPANVSICLENTDDNTDKMKITVYSTTGRVEVLDAC